MGFDPVAALRSIRGRDAYRERCVLEGPQAAEVQVDQRRLVNFCSNDYLGLANHPAVREAFRRAAERYGVGAGAAHLVCGHSAAHHALEEELAEFLGRDRTLLFSTGYMANLGVISALVGRGDAVFEDRLNHASLLDGGLLSGARFYRYPHRDWRALDAALAGSKAALRLVVTDGVFSMEGDLAPLPELVRTVRERDAWLMMDDAHGIGVLGANGRGTLEHFGLGASEVPVLVGTLGKALGAFGAFVTGEADFVDYLMQRARTYIYTTALPPAVAEAARASLRIVREELERREALQRNIRRFRAGALQSGLPLADSFTPIQPILIGDNRLALAASHALAERGFWVSAIRPPTVPEGAARLRVTLTANHTAEQVDRLLDALAAVLSTSSSGMNLDREAGPVGASPREGTSTSSSGATKLPGAILDSEAGPEGVSPREGANSLDRAAGPQTPSPQTPMFPGHPARNPPGGLHPTQSAPGGLVPEGEGVGLRNRASPEDGMSNGE